MKIKWLFILIGIVTFFQMSAQDITHKQPLRVGVFASLFLDSAFSANGTYKYDMQMPKHLLPGLDFTEGMLIALDSLAETDNLEVRIYDIKSRNQQINYLKNRNLFDSLDLIIGAVSGTDYRQLADIALQFQVPFLSATQPNDGGITQNPFTIIINPTISVHCKAIFNFLQQRFATANLIFLQKKGAQDVKIKQYFDSYNLSKNGSKALKWTYHLTQDSLNMAEIEFLFDSTKQNVIICGSFDEKLASECLNLPPSYKSYNIQYVGLPNWETLKELNQPRHKEKTIYYPTAFYNDGSAGFQNFQHTFQEKTQGKASDIAYKGYDLGINFIQLLRKYQFNFINQLNDISFQNFINYNIQPVKLSGKTQPDYFENKRIYLIKKNNGLTSSSGKF